MATINYISACLLYHVLISSVLAGPRVSDIVYYLFTRQNPDFSDKQVIKFNDPDSLKESLFDGQKPTRVLIHGWFGGISSPMATWLAPMKDAFLKKQDVNVICVDWGKLARSPLYFGPARNTRFVGRTTATFIEFLEQETGMSRKNVHIIGHSLGGQVSGFTGMHLDPRPARISGMDTAEFGFDVENNDDTLDPSDADFVDEIHTLVSYGDKGHADFYPNGGSNPTVLKIAEHSHAWRFYINSILAGTCAYKGFTCSDYDQYKAGCRSNDGNRMGYYAFKPRSKTEYFLEAKPEAEAKEVCDGL